MNKCKICGREPKIENHPSGSKVMVSCTTPVNEEEGHYIAVEAISKDKAIEKWESLMTVSVN